MASAMLKAASDGTASLPISIPLSRTLRSPNSEENNAKRPPNIFEKMNILKTAGENQNMLPETAGASTSRSTEILVIW